MISTLTTVISIFLLLIVGYVAKKTGVLSVKDTPVTTTIVVYLSMPALIFVSIHKQSITPAMVRAPFLLFACEIAVMGVAYLLCRAMQLDRRTTGAIMLVSSFGNTGFLGYPVITAAFPGQSNAMTATVLMDIFGAQMMLAVLGVSVASSFAGTNFEWRRIFENFRTPLVWGTILALIFRTVEVPQVILSTLQYLANATVPLAMISVGLSLSTGSIKQYPVPLITAALLKMVLLPVMLYFMFPLIGVTGIVAKVGVIEAAMPCSVVSGVITARYGGNGVLAAAAIALSTLLAALWIPAVLVYLH